jgi:hypothetical protein
MHKPIIIYDVEYTDPNLQDWKLECIPELVVTEEQYETFVRGYAPDWECRYAPYYYEDWFYITRSGYWLKKFSFKKQIDNLYHLRDHYSSVKADGRNLLCEILLEGYFQPSLVDVGIKYQKIIYYQHLFKYYHFENENPYPANDVRSQFWHGEMMFASGGLSVKECAERGQQILKNASVEVRRKAAQYSPEQFGVIVYIEMLFAKWRPYDDLDWIFEY